MKILILNGPNLNLLGEREPETYGTLTLAQLQEEVTEHVLVSHPNIESLDFFQSNSEGTLIDTLHAARSKFSAVIFNPAAYTHYSYALRDAIAAINIPVVEVHLSNIQNREDFRKTNVIREVCTAHFQSNGVQSYKDAIDYLVDCLSG